MHKTLFIKDSENTENINIGMQNVQKKNGSDCQTMKLVFKHISVLNEHF